ncbi:MAG: hypothetical protein ACFFDW_01915, partial [Candidatus Thorarchaeota archaeon]
LKKTYHELIVLRDTAQEDTLLSLFRHSLTYLLYDTSKAMLILYALADLRSHSIYDCINDLLLHLESSTSDYAPQTRSLCRRLQAELEVEGIVVPELKQVVKEREFVVPVTKVYFVDAKKFPNENCMITSLPLDFATNEILVCPFCGNFARKEPLLNWLREKRVCPVCYKPLSPDDCPEVVVK